MTWYQACPKCSSTFKLANNCLNCIKYNEHPPTRVPRAKVKLQVTDSTRQVDVTVFGEDNNKIFCMSRTSLLQILTKENNVDEMKDIIEVRLWKKYSFTIKVTTKITNTPYFEASLHLVSMQWKRN